MSEHGISKVIGTSVETAAAKGATVTGLAAGPIAIFTEYANIFAVVASTLLAIVTTRYWYKKGVREQKALELNTRKVEAEIALATQKAAEEKVRLDMFAEYYTQGDRRKKQLTPDEALAIICDEPQHDPSFDEICVERDKKPTP